MKARIASILAILWMSWFLSSRIYKWQPKMKVKVGDHYQEKTDVTIIFALKWMAILSMNVCLMCLIWVVDRGL